MGTADLENLIRRAVAEAMEQAAVPRLAFTEPEAAAMLGVKPHVLRDARLRGEIKSTKLGSRIGYRREELDRYLLENEA